MGLKENFVLFLINIRVKFANFLDYLKVVYKYYPRFHFFKIDSALLASYFFSNPFRVSKEFLLRKGEEDIYTYGETPLTTMDLIAKECSISSQDLVYEMGCGRGRTCFWLHEFIGCKVVGVDYVPLFIEKAKRVQKRFNVKGIKFLLEDIFQMKLKNASVVYLYGSCYSAEQIGLLIERFTKLPKGTKIITVSYALTEFQPEAPFQILKVFEGKFTWGKTDVYLQEKT